MDSIEECSQCGDSAVSSASVSCIIAMLSSLEQLCLGKGISHSYIECINSLYPELNQCDYQGFYIMPEIVGDCNFRCS
jgi:hypothetical protein